MHQLSTVYTITSCLVPCHYIHSPLTSPNGNDIEYKYYAMSDLFSRKMIFNTWQLEIGPYSLDLLLTGLNGSVVCSICESSSLLVARYIDCSQV